jgi:hypothetical protein
VENHASSVSYKQAVQYCPLRKSVFARLRCWKNTEQVKTTMVKPLMDRRAQNATNAMPEQRQP